MEYKFIVTEVKNNIGIVILNRPEVLNTLNRQTLEEVATAMEAFDQDAKIKAMVIQGNDRAFCAGIDVKEFGEKIGELNKTIELFKNNILRIHKIKKPIIAAAAGYVLGIGAELLLCADIVLAADSFRLGLPEASLGMISGSGVLNKLIQMIGKSKTMEMALCGRAIMGAEAESSGIVSRIVPLQDLFDDALKTAMKTTENPLFAILAIKESARSEEYRDDIKRIDETAMRNKILITTDEFHDYIMNFNNPQK